MQVLKNHSHPDAEKTVSELTLKEVAGVVIASPTCTLPVPIRAHVRTEDKVVFVVILDNNM
jgi:hypothetical protein